MHQSIITRQWVAHLSQFVKANKESIKDPNYWPFVEGIHWWPIIFLTKGLIMQKAFTCYDTIMNPNGTCLDNRSSWHHSDVIVGAMVSQIISLTIVYWTIHSGTDLRKHQSSASLAFVGGIHRWPVNSLHKWPVTRKMFPFDDVFFFLTHWSCFFYYCFSLSTEYTFTNRTTD